MRIFGGILIALGLLILVSTPLLYYELAVLACGMKTTGCSNFQFPWSQAMVDVPPFLLLGVTILGLGWFFFAKARMKQN